MKHLSIKLLASTCFAVLIWSNPAAAQDAGSSTGADNAGLGDIIVTAQKREQRLQDVPIAVSAQTNAQLQASGISSTLQLAEVNASRPHEHARRIAPSTSGSTQILDRSSCSPVSIAIDDSTCSKQARRLGRRLITHCTRDVRR